MLKLKKGTNEYEVLGQITFKTEDDIEQTNYTIVVNGETVTVESTDPSYEVFEAPDPEPVVEEPEPTPEPELIPEPIPPTQEEIDRNLWLEKFQLLQKSMRAKKTLEEVGMSFSPDEQVRFDQLVAWVAANRKTEYVEYM